MMFEQISLYILPIIILVILTTGMIKRVPIYEEFIEGAKDGFTVSVKIIPYLVALIVAISMLRASGAIDFLSNLFTSIFSNLNIPADIIPIIFTRSLSGAATLGVFSDIVSHNGPDSFVVFLSAIMVGSSETTFYVLSVYFGSVGIKKFKYAIWVGVLADIIGIVLAILVAQLFFLPNIA